MALMELIEKKITSCIGKKIYTVGVFIDFFFKHLT